MKNAAGLLLIWSVLFINGQLSAQGPRLEFLGRLADSQGLLSLGGAHGIAVSPDGHRVYVASFDDNALVVLTRDLVTGAVTFSEAKLDQYAGVRGLFRPLSVVVSPDGRHVYVGSFFGDAVAAFARDDITGELRFVDALFGGAAGHFGLTQIHGLAFAPDGFQVFAVSYGDNAVTVLARDPESGQLTLRQTLRDRSEGGSVDGLLRPTGIAVSPEGANVFVVAGGSQSLVHLQRSEETGLLTPLESFFEGVGGIMGLDGAVAVTVSPDGRDVYPLGSDAIGQFRFNDGGGLDFVAALSDPRVIGQGEASGPSALAVVPQGSAMLLARGGDDALVLLERDLVTGRLQFADVARNGENGVEGLAGAADVSVDSTGRFIYVASQFDDSVAVFRRWPRCHGDCNEDGAVTVEELVGAVTSLLAETQPLVCWQVDRSGDGLVSVDEVVAAVLRGLTGCTP